MFHETQFLTFQVSKMSQKKYAALILAVEFEFEEKLELSRFWKKVRILTAENFSKFQEIDIVCHFEEFSRILQ